MIVTGANSGIGRATARALAGAGARVVLAVRDPDKGREPPPRRWPGRPKFASSISRASPPCASSPRLGRRDRPADQQCRRDGPPLTRTADGFELQFGTNHLGHFALTNLLLEHVTGRVVTVSSTGHRLGRIDFDDLNWERKPYRPWRAYGQSKLANLLFTAELQRRLTGAASPVLATAAHPGYASTNLQFHSGKPWWTRSGLGNRLIAQDEEGGALPTLYAAVADIPGDSFAGPSGFMEQRGPQAGGTFEGRQSAGVASRLWDVSEELTGVRFPLARHSAA